MIAEELTNTNSEGVLINHNFTWMPPNREDCPCTECQDWLECEEAIDRHAIWPHAEDWLVSMSTEYLWMAYCVCGGRIVVGPMDRKETITKALPYVLVQVYGWDESGGVRFRSVLKVRLHTWCSLKTRTDLDMENHVGSVLILEGLPPKGYQRLRQLYAPAPEEMEPALPPPSPDAPVKRVAKRDKDQDTGGAIVDWNKVGKLGTQQH